ncbi:hypothetical protein C9994_04120 [Marivirga lumbricoides]|uniref:DUF3592 domain-containing protein n=1 Tax=Marivirga lumbricoides TaxID=1046115 RepID=A0A2T4DTL0_9BACT|nr:hypothetical protein C9994_04120 [Marivirga lumbricoides]
MKLSEFNGAPRIILILIISILIIRCISIANQPETNLIRTSGKVLGIRTVTEKTGRFGTDNFYYLDLTNGNSYKIGLVKKNESFKDEVKADDSVVLFKHQITNEVWKLKNDQKIIIEQNKIIAEYTIFIIILFLVVIILLFLPIIQKKVFIEN